MKIVTINIPDAYLDCIHELVEMDIYLSRSEAVREALKRFLVKEVDLNDDLDPARFRELKENQIDQLRKLQK